MSAIGHRRRRRRGMLVFIVLFGLIGVAAAAMSAFHIGMLSGLAVGGGVLVIYTVPATIFDWPRITWEHISAFFAAILAAVGGFFASLFGW